jgi:DNA-binding transcriptional ArsR family regulator
VSNHVRVLREAGLLSDVRQGTRRNLVVQADAAGDLLADLRGVLVAGAGE